MTHERPLPFGGAFVVSQSFATVLRCATFAPPTRRPPRPMAQDPRSACTSGDPQQRVRAWSWVVHERGFTGGHLGGRSRSKGLRLDRQRSPLRSHTAPTIREGRRAPPDIHELGHDGYSMHRHGHIVRPIHSHAAGAGRGHWMIDCHNGSSETGHDVPAGLHRMSSARLRSGRGGRSRRWPL